MECSAPAKPFKPTDRQRRAIEAATGIAGNVLLYGGSRSGKTFILLYMLIYRALKEPTSRHAVFRLHFNAVKQSVVLDTLPKVMALCFPLITYRLNRTDWYVSFPNKSELWFGGLDDKERVDKILGKEFASIWFNECSEIPLDSVHTGLTRLAQKTYLRNRVYFDCNPPSKRHWVYKMFFGPGATDGYVALQMNPCDNRENVAPGYIDSILSGLTHSKRKRFLDGEFFDVVEGALWKQAQIDADRIPKIPDGVTMARIVVALDPSCTDTGDEAGIVVAGKGTDGLYYLLDDLSMQGTPDAWAREACRAFHRWHADRIVYETNQGGQMVTLTLSTCDAKIPTRGIHASRGKITRAEPIAALAEQHKIKHVGAFPKLEDELCSYDGSAGQASPNRLDAYVYAFTELHQRAPQSISYS